MSSIRFEKPLKIHFDRKWDGGLDIFAVTYRDDRAMSLRYKITIEALEFHETQRIEPTATFFRGQGDTLIDALIDGLKAANLLTPTSKDVDGELKATKVHLADLQKLVFEPVRMTKIIRHINETES